MRIEQQNIAFASSSREVVDRKFSRYLSEEELRSIPRAFVLAQQSSRKSALLHRMTHGINQVVFRQFQGFDEKQMDRFLQDLDKELRKLSMQKVSGPVCLCLDDVDHILDPGALKMLAAFLRSQGDSVSIYLGISTLWLRLNAEFTQMLEWPFLFVNTPNNKDLSSALREALSERSLWLAGSAWGKEEQLERFLEQSIWEKGKTNGDENAILAARPGDIVFLKSTFSHRTTKDSILRIKAVGVVIENPGNGRGLVVNWEALVSHLDFPGLGNYRRTFQRLSVRDVDEVLEYLLAVRPDFFEWIDFLFKDKTFRAQYEKAREQLRAQSTEDADVATKTAGGDAGSGGGGDDGVVGTDGTAEEPEDNRPGFPSGPRVEFGYADAISSDQGEKDSLNFTRDVQALAALIALKEIDPPLAIALFGKWGSGKSFFMKAIEKNVRQLSQHQGFLVESERAGPQDNAGKEEIFYRGIAHIKFNAWSYMDANLWAGLAHSLFEKLDLYIRDNTKGELERLKVQVKITKRLELLHSDLENYEGKRSQLEELKSKLERERNDVLLKWFQPKYDARVKAFLRMCGLEDKQIEKLLPSELKPYAEKAAHFIAYLRHNSYRVPLIIVGSVALIWLYKGLIAPALPQQALPDFLKSFWSGLTLSVMPVVGAVVHFIAKHRKFFKKLGTLMGEEDRLKTPEPESENPDAVQSQLQRINELIAQVKEGIQEEKANQSNITELAIQNFVAEIPANEDYKKHLGIITTIRRDFETLSDLFAEKDKDPDRAHNPKEEARIKELNSDRREIREAFDGKGNQKLDRIVLYIDDLDRCSDEKVLEVLQAVHLLMAFPLFIVIVGVDERCVNNALTYAQLKRYRGLDRQLIDEYIHEIEPREYLEKIFQIPFQLPLASEAGVHQLIDDIIPNPAEELEAAPLPEEAAHTPDTGSDEDVFLHLATTRADAERAVEREDEVTASQELAVDEAMDEQPAEDPTAEPAYVAVRPEAIRITQAEKEMLQVLAPLVGTNPRTIKRYVNIFRIVKTHEQSAVQSPLDMAKVVFLLAMFIGDHRKQAIEIFKSAHSLTVADYAQEHHPALSALMERLEAAQPELGEVLNAQPDSFLHLLPFVERFSYKIVLTMAPEKSNAAQ